MRTIALGAIEVAPLFVATLLVAAPAADAYPSGSCYGVGTVAREDNAYTLCTSSGWVHVDRSVNPSGSCASVGTVGPHDDATYTVCTNVGWVDVDRSVCADFFDVFTCTVTPRL